MRHKVLLLASLAVLALLLASGCPLPGVVGFIKLQVLAPAASRGIEVGDFKVTGLRIQVRDPEEQLRDTVDWDAEEGPRCYYIPVKRAGEHGIELTHFGERNGDMVEASESAVFDVRARKITVIEVVPGRIGVIRVEREEE